MSLHQLDKTIRGVDVSRVDVANGALRLAQPLRTSKGTFHRREIAIIRVESPDGAFGYGEAAPLNGWGSEPIDTIRSVFGRLAERPLENGAELLEAAPGPTARFAIETALLDLVARQAGVPLRDLLNPADSFARVPVNVTIGSDSPPRVRDRAMQLVDDGFNCIKLKVGDADWATDVASIRAAAASGALIRIDANGAWQPDDAISILERISTDIDIEYCEQPVPPDPREWMRRVASSVSVPIAADESCHPWPRPLDVIEMRSADVLVLKPMVIGGLLRCLELYRRAVRQEMSVVFTSSIDGAIGRCAVAQMVASITDIPIGNAPRHHGLATGEWFERDIADLKIERGSIVLPDGPGLGIWPLVNALEPS